MENNIKQKFKEKIAKEPVLGVFNKTIDSNFIEATGLSGLDFVILDMEHGSANLETMHNHVRAAIITNILPIIRVKDINAHSIGSALDTGALGIQVPNISTAEEAQAAVKAARFYPKGMRGVCRFVKSGKFGSIQKDEYFNDANESLLILQVEGTEGINNLDEILNIKNFDILFVGPYDLSQSIGKPGQVESPEVLELMSEIIKKANKKGILVGSFSDSYERNKSLIKEGFSYIAYSVDVNIYLEGCKQIRSKSI